MTKDAGRIRNSSSFVGLWAFFPINCEPKTSSIISIFLLRNSSLYAHSALIIQVSPSTFTFLYTISGFIQRFVTPNNVSGRSVATGIIASSMLNFITIYSVKSGSTSPSVSCCETGF